jgi:hypothetical protein
MWGELKSLHQLIVQSVLLAPPPVSCHQGILLLGDCFLCVDGCVRTISYYSLMTVRAPGNLLSHPLNFNHILSHQAEQRGTGGES